ncbi:zinc ribbon domain-containing protein [Streptomyces sp. NPDC057909]|uniref:zinc ribbon domain-containing protein n=1 Tax=Streptomyces sp. NPDC057909 TaxID=3346277 RepID=UPI0036E245B1
MDPRNTSRRCPACAHTAKENRPTQAKFHCTACGHTAHADTVGALNVLRAGLVRRNANTA